MEKIPVVMCIDVEPEERLIPTVAQQSWPGFEGTVEFFNDQRRRIESATGSPVHYSWFFRMDPQIARAYSTAAWVVKRYSSIVAKLRKAGDACGLHVHPWRWDETLDQWIADFADQKWVDQCVRLAFESFHEAFGENCRYFRFGDHWMNNATLRLVNRLGAKFDLTLEPGQRGGHTTEVFTGSFVDCTNVPRFPYRPSRSDFRKPAYILGRRLWMIPLSVGPASASQPSMAGEFARKLESKTDDAQDYITLNLYFDSLTLSRIIDGLLSSSRYPYLALVVRTDIVTHPEQHLNLRRTLDWLLNHRLAAQLAFETPSEMIRRIR